MVLKLVVDAHGIIMVFNNIIRLAFALIFRNTQRCAQVRIILNSYYYIQYQLPFFGKNLCV